MRESAYLGKNRSADPLFATSRMAKKQATHGGEWPVLAKSSGEEGKVVLHARRRRAGRRALCRSGRRVVTGRVRHQANIHTTVFRAAV